MICLTTVTVCGGGGLGGGGGQDFIKFIRGIRVRPFLLSAMYDLCDAID